MNKFRVLQKCLVSCGLLIVAIIIFSALVNAQSGRRIKTPIPAPTPVPEAAPTPTPEPEPVKPQYTFRVLRYISFNVRNQLSAPENIPGWTVERLAASPLLEVELGGESNRKDSGKSSE